VPPGEDLSAAHSASPGELVSDWAHIYTETISASVASTDPGTAGAELFQPEWSDTMTTKHAKYFAAAFGITAFLLGTSFSGTDELWLSLVNYGGAIFAIFLYLNPAVLIARSIQEIDEILETAEGIQFVWIGIGVALLGPFINAC
jgi:hypothetical protein